MSIVLLIIGILWVVLSFVMKTKNFISSLVFKIFPFFSGMFVIVYGIMQLGIITIN